MYTNDNMNTDQVNKKINIFRVCKNKNNPYLLLNKTALHDSRLSWKAKGIHSYMLSMPDDWVFHRDELATHATDGIDSLKSGLAELGNTGYIEIKMIRDAKGRIVGWETVVFEQPQAHLIQISTRSGKSTSGKSTSGKSNPTNNDLTNNDLTNNDLIDHSSNDLNADKKLIKNEDRLTADQIQEIFNKLWPLYPLKVAKQAALKAFTKIFKGKPMKEAEELANAILLGLTAYITERETKESLQKQGAKIWVAELPHLSTWLNNKRWDDEYQTPEQLLKDAKPKFGGLNLDAFRASLNQASSIPIEEVAANQKTHAEAKEEAIQILKNKGILDPRDGSRNVDYEACRAYDINLEKLIQKLLHKEKL